MKNKTKFILWASECWKLCMALPFSNQFTRGYILVFHRSSSTFLYVCVWVFKHQTLKSKSILLFYLGRMHQTVVVAHTLAQKLPHARSSIQWQLKHPNTQDTWWSPPPNMLRTRDTHTHTHTALNFSPLNDQSEKQPMLLANIQKILKLE